MGDCPDVACIVCLWCVAYVTTRCIAQIRQPGFPSNNLNTPMLPRCQLAVMARSSSCFVSQLLLHRRPASTIAGGPSGGAPARSPPSEDPWWLVYLNAVDAHNDDRRSLTTTKMKAAPPDMTHPSTTCSSSHRPCRPRRKVTKREKISLERLWKAISDARRQNRTDGAPRRRKLHPGGVTRRPRPPTISVGGRRTTQQSLEEGGVRNDSAAAEAAYQRDAERRSAQLEQELADDISRAIATGSR